jgi:hypothetical protein
MEAHQAEVLVGLGLTGPVEGVAQVQHPANVPGSHDLGGAAHEPAALPGHLLVPGEGPLGLDGGARLPLAAGRLVVQEALEGIEDYSLGVEGRAVQQVLATLAKPPAAQLRATKVVVEFGTLAVDARVRVELVVLVEELLPAALDPDLVPGSALLVKALAAGEEPALAVAARAEATLRLPELVARGAVALGLVGLAVDAVDALEARLPGEYRGRADAPRVEALGVTGLARAARVPVQEVQRLRVPVVVVGAADTPEPALDGGARGRQGDVPGGLVARAQRCQKPAHELHLVALPRGRGGTGAARVLVHSTALAVVLSRPFSSSSRSLFLCAGARALSLSLSLSPSRACSCSPPLGPTLCLAHSCSCSCFCSWSLIPRSSTKRLYSIF